MAYMMQNNYRMCDRLECICLYCDKGCKVCNEEKPEKCLLTDFREKTFRCIQLETGELTSKGE